MFKLVKKTSLLKDLAKRWHKRTFNNIHKQIFETDEQLLQLQQKLLVSPNQELSDRHKRLLNKRERMLDFQRRYWSQRAKVKHIRLNATNSSYFHRIASAKRGRKIVKVLTTESGLILSDHNLIRNEFVDSFAKRFKSSYNHDIPCDDDLLVIDREISDQQNQMLTAPITNANIKTALFSIGGDKAPGPDGMPAGFYQTY